MTRAQLFILVMVALVLLINLLARVLRRLRACLEKQGIDRAAALNALTAP